MVYNYFLLRRVKYKILRVACQSVQGKALSFEISPCTACQKVQGKATWNFSARRATRYRAKPVTQRNKIGILCIIGAWEG